MIEKKEIVIIENSSTLGKKLTTVVNSLENINVSFLKADPINCCEFINGHKPNILILGINIATKECLEQLRKTKNSNPEIQIIVLSDNPYDQLKKVCMHAGADYFLDKSHDLNKVIEICSTETVNN